MADAYSFVKGGKLNLKGGKHKKHSKHKKHKRKNAEDSTDEHISEDTVRHGGWWQVTEFSQVMGAISIEMRSMAYLEAKDNGLFVLGQSHEIGLGPDPEEIFMVIHINDTKVALKSGYDKYLSVATDGLVTGRADAVGSREQWEPVFQEDKVAFMGCNNCFLSISDSGDAMCVNKQAGEDEQITVRSSHKEEVKEDNRPIEMRVTSSKETEVHYVKMFQSFQDRKLKVNAGDRSKIKKARLEGNLHEELLDRRSKMKSDRYCK